MWADAPQVSEWKENVKVEKRKEITNEVKCKKITECSSYEEFKDHVAAAFLKPIDLYGKNKGGGGEATSASAHDKNVSSLLEKETTADVCAKLAKELESARVSEVKCPTNSNQFDSDWRRLCKTDADKVSYLRKIPPKKYKSIFRVEGSLSVLGEIIDAFGSERKKSLTAPAKEQKLDDSVAELDGLIVATLKGLMRVKGIGMAIAFLEESEVEMAKTLCKQLVELGQERASIIGYTLEDVDHILEKLSEE
mmetsp:Transcript_21415/g.42971  ORF Transcript_21415/g.42971 Transcript_21415/m.42971 type:complete len:251 (+) Transcript_21415:117-869(+)